MPGAENLQPLPGSNHIKVIRADGGELRIELRPGHATKLIFMAIYAAIAGYAGWRIFRSGGPPPVPESGSMRFGRILIVMLMFPVAFLYATTILWLPLGSEILVINGNVLSMTQAVAGFRSTDEFDLWKIHRLRYEPISGRGFRMTIRFEHAQLNHGFGKDLTEVEARWLIDLIQTRIDGSRKSPEGAA